MKATRVCAFAVVAFLAVMAAEASQVVAEGFMVGEEHQMMVLLNQERVQNGLAPLAENDALKTIARRQAQAMAAAGYIYHTTDLAEQAKSLNLNYSLLGENVGTGPSVESVQAAFMASPHHRENILEPKYTVGAIGASSGGGSLYFSQNFAALRSAPAAVRSVTRPVTTRPAAPARTARPAVTRPVAPQPAPAAARVATPKPEKPTLNPVRTLDRFSAMAGVASPGAQTDSVEAPAPTMPKTVGGMVGRFFATLAFWKAA